MNHVRCYWTESTADRYCSIGSFKMSREILGQVGLETYKEILDGEAESVTDHNSVIIYSKHSPDGTVLIASALKHDPKSPNKLVMYDKIPNFVKDVKIKFLTNLTNFKKRIGDDDLLDILDI